MARKSFKHKCDVQNGDGGLKNYMKRISPLHKQRTPDRSLKFMFNRYYKDQVEALYRAVKGK